LLDGALLSQPMTFDIAAAVRKDDVALAAELDAALRKHRAEINAVLKWYGVPRIDLPDTGLRP
jgi:mxaJ protein